MTFWAKLLVIIVLVLSIAFAAASGVLYAKRTNYRGQLEKAQAQAKTERDGLSKQINQLEGRAADADKTVADLKMKVVNRENDIKQLEKTQKILEGGKAKLELRLADASANEKTLALSNKALADTNTDLRASYDKIKTESEKYRADLHVERTKTAKLEKNVTDLTDERDGLKVGLAGATKKLATQDEILAELADRGIEPMTVIRHMRIIPDIKTKVASVDLENRIVVLNAGTEQGVKKNYEFTIFRDDKFVATVNVFDLQDSYCAARIVTGKGEIRLGDNAWTRLP